MGYPRIKDEVSHSPQRKIRKEVGKRKAEDSELESILEKDLTEHEVHQRVPVAPCMTQRMFISWKSSDDDQDDEKAQDDEAEDKNDIDETTHDDEDDDEHDDDEKAQDDDDEEQTESEDDGDDFIHPKQQPHDDDIIHEEETDEEILRSYIHTLPLVYFIISMTKWWTLMWKDECFEGATSDEDATM
ncbi:hypothetical protein Tco_1440720 [Tanacetum coccineum]